jgi:hypothetical protein
MSDNKKRILEMLDAGKLSVDEAMKLLEALDRDSGERPAFETARPSPRSIKYLRVMVDVPEDHRGIHGERPGKVNIRVPVALLRAGMKFKSLLPREASDKIEVALKDKGIDLNLKNIKDEDFEAFIQALSELEVDVDADNSKVRITAE